MHICIPVEADPIGLSMVRLWSREACVLCIADVDMTGGVDYRVADNRFHC